MAMLNGRKRTETIAVCHSCENSFEISDYLVLLYPYFQPVRQLSCFLLLSHAAAVGQEAHREAPLVQAAIVQLQNNYMLLI